MKRSWSVAALTLALFAASELAIHADVRTDRKTRFELAGALGRMVNMFSRTAREGVTMAMNRFNVSMRATRDAATRVERENAPDGER